MALFDLKIGDSFSFKIGRDKPTVQKGVTINNTAFDPQTSTFEFIGGKLALTSPSKEGGTLYAQCPPLNYILNKKAQLHNRGQIKIVNPTTLNEPKKYLERFAEYDRLLRYPNPLQTELQFRAQVTTTMLLYPYCAVLKIVPTGFNIPAQLWALPSQFLELERNNTPPIFANSVQDLIKSVKFKANGTETTLNKEDLYFFTAPNASYEDMFAPQPVVEALKPHCVNIINILESRGQIIQHQGAKGILSNTAKDDISTVPMSQKDKEELHKDWSQYGLLKWQKRIIISNASLSWQQIGSPFAELQLLEQYKDDIMNLANGLDFKFQLLSQGTETAFNNQNKAYAAQYRDSVIPEADNYIRQYNDCVNAEENGVTHIVDYTNTLNELVDKKEESEIRKNNTTSLLTQFTACSIIYDEMIAEMGNKEVNPAFKGKFFNELSPEDQQLFKMKPNENTNASGDQGNQGEGNNGQKNN